MVGIPRWPPGPPPLLSESGKVQRREALLRNADIWASWMSDPNAPACCARALVAVLAPTITNDEAGMELFRTKNHTFFHCCVRFLMAKRTDRDVDALERRLDSCSCDMSDPNMAMAHDMAERVPYPYPQVTLWDLADVIIHILVLSLMSAISRKDVGGHSAAPGLSRHSKKAIKRTGGQLWPTDPKDLLPFGPEESIYGLRVWISRVRTKDELAKFFRSIAEICGSFAIPSIIKCTALIDSWVEFWHDYLPKWQTIVAIPSVDAEFKRDAATHMVRFLHQVSVLCRFLLEDASEEDFLAFASYREDSLLSLANSIIDASPGLAEYMRDERGNDRQMTLGAWFSLGALMHYRLNRPHDPTKYNPGLLTSSEEQQLTETPSVVVWSAFQRFHNDRRCFAPGCTATVPGEGHKFPLCGGCKRVPFCSKACQTRAWKYPAAPHRAVCKKLATVAERAGIPERPQAIRDPRKLGGIIRFAKMCDPKSGENGIEEFDPELSAMTVEIAHHMRHLLKQFSVIGQP